MGMLSNGLHMLPVEDCATTLIGYRGGVHAVVDVRWNSQIARDELRVVGSEGALELTPLNGPALTLVLPGGEVREEHPTHANVHLPMIANFVAAVLDGAPLACPMEEAIQTDWVTQQVMDGYRGGLSAPLETERG